MTLSVSSGPGDRRGARRQRPTEKQTRPSGWRTPASRSIRSSASRRHRPRGPRDRHRAGGRDAEIQTGSTVNAADLQRLEQGRGARRDRARRPAGAERARATPSWPATSSSATTTRPPGEVVGQSPGAGELVKRGAQVTIFVSSGAIAVPDVVGQTAQAGGDRAEAGRLHASRSARSRRPIPPRTAVVINQFPPGGSRGQRGDTVTITVGVAATPPPP